MTPSTPPPPLDPPAAAPPRPRGFFRRWLNWRRLPLVLLSLLLLAEGSLRLLGLGNPVLYRPDPDCGYLPAPSQDVSRFFKRNSINHLGMRSPEVSDRKPPGTFRLLLVGDSVTYGTTYVDQSQIFATLLGRDLPAQLHQPVEVLNAAVGAWAISNEVGFLRSHGTFDADRVLIVLNTGDLVQPFCTTDFTLRSGYTSYRPTFALTEAWVRYVEPRLTHHSTADAGSFAPAAATVLPFGPLLDLLDQARQTVDAAGGHLGIVFSPCVGAEWKPPLYDQRLALLKQWAAQRHVGVLDLGSAYAKLGPAATYFDGTHLRPAGHEAVARAIEENWATFDPPAKSPATRP